MKNLLTRLKNWARNIKRQVMVLWFCCKHPETPWLPKVIAICVVAYALSPIDLIPDFIPVLGYLDDAILVPLGMLLALRLMPASVITDCRLKASEWEEKHEPKPINKMMIVVVIAVWISIAFWAWSEYSSQ